MYVGYLIYISYVSHMIIFMNCLKSFFFVFKKIGIILLIYMDEIPKLSNLSESMKRYLNIMQKNHFSGKGKECKE